MIFLLKQNKKFENWCKNMNFFRDQLRLDENVETAAVNEGLFVNKVKAWFCLLHSKVYFFPLAGFSRCYHVPECHKHSCMHQCGSLHAPLIGQFALGWFCCYAEAWMVACGRDWGSKLRENKHSNTITGSFTALVFCCDQIDND